MRDPALLTLSMRMPPSLLSPPLHCALSLCVVPTDLMTCDSSATPQRTHCSSIHALSGLAHVLTCPAPSALFFRPPSLSLPSTLSPPSFPRSLPSLPPPLPLSRPSLAPIYFRHKHAAAGASRSRATSRRRSRVCRARRAWTAAARSPLSTTPWPQRALRTRPSEEPPCS